MTQFSQFVRPLSYSVLDVFDNFLLIYATARSKISSAQKRFFIALSLYPLSFFAKTPFKNQLRNNFFSDGYGFCPWEGNGSSQNEIKKFEKHFFIV